MREPEIKEVDGVPLAEIMRRDEILSVKKWGTKGEVGRLEHEYAKIKEREGREKS